MGSYLWFHIAMADPFLMENLKPFQYLFRDLSCILLCCFIIRHVSTQVAVIDVLHCEKDFVFVFEPAEELHKQVAILENHDN